MVTLLVFPPTFFAKIQAFLPSSSYVCSGSLKSVQKRRKWLTFSMHFLFHNCFTSFVTDLISQSKLDCYLKRSLPNIQTNLRIIIDDSNWPLDNHQNVKVFHKQIVFNYIKCSIKRSTYLLRLWLGNFVIAHIMI